MDPPTKDAPTLAIDRAWQACAVLAASVPAALIVTFLFVRLIANAQAACLDIGPGQGFFLTGVWIGLAIAGWWLFWVGALVTWRLGLVVRLATGLGLLLVLCLLAVWWLVPWGSAADDPTPTSRHCGPGGIPTWWPPILPHH